MKPLPLFFLFAFGTAALLTACNGKTSSNSKLKGDWKSKEGTSLKITAKQFTMADTESPIAEDYFTKGDTIFTSFEGNQPYTRFVIQKLDDHNLHLLFPDSVTIAFTR